METKKSEKADLEWRKPVFFEIGLCVALALVLTAFDVIGPREKNEGGFQMTEIFVDDETVLNTKREEPPQTPPEPVQNTTQIKAIDNNIELLDNLSFETEVGEDEIVPEYSGPMDEIGEDESKEEEIFTVVEELASFPGGDEALTKYLRENLAYPRAAIDAQAQGRVFVEFVVEKDGRISNVKIKRSVMPALDEEAIRVVKAMPKWNAGKQLNKAVRSRFTLPINFVLNN